MCGMHRYLCICCSVLQCFHFVHTHFVIRLRYAEKCVAVCCSVLQLVAACMRIMYVLQCVAVCCSVLQCVAVCFSLTRPTSCKTLPHTASHCPKLLHTCSMEQCEAGRGIVFVYSCIYIFIIRLTLLHTTKCSNVGQGKEMCCSVRGLYIYIYIYILYIYIYTYIYIYIYISRFKCEARRRKTMLPTLTHFVHIPTHYQILQCEAGQGNVLQCEKMCCSVRPRRAENTFPRPATN